MAQDSFIAEHAQLLARVDLFAGLSRLTLAKLAAHLVPVDLAAGEELFRQPFSCLTRAPLISRCITGPAAKFSATNRRGWSR